MAGIWEEQFGTPKRFTFGRKIIATKISRTGRFVELGSINFWTFVK